MFLNDNLKVFSGSSNPALAGKICKYLGIPVGGVLVNLLIDKESVAHDAPDFVLNRIAMQDNYMEEIWRSFPDVRAIVPLFEKEVRGVEMLERTANHMFA